MQANYELIRSLEVHQILQKIEEHDCDQGVVEIKAGGLGTIQNAMEGRT